jgi:thiaminase
MQPKLRPITVYCSDELYAWIEHYASQDSRTMSSWIRRKLDQARVKTLSQVPSPPVEARVS